MKEPTDEEIRCAVADLHDIALTLATVELTLRRIAEGIETLTAQDSSKKTEGGFSNALVTCPDCRAMYFVGMPHTCNFSSAMDS